MNDLLASMDEALEERKAIMIDSNVPDHIDMAEEDRHRSEVKAVIRRFFPDGDPQPYFGLVKAKHGNDAAERLIVDCREAWRREIETRKAQRANVDSGKVVK